MKQLIILEEIAQLALAAFALYSFDAVWWCWLLLLLGPDISMLGYAAGNRIGAYAYNLFHHKGIAVMVFIAGVFMANHPLMIAGAILFGHSALDRIFGYGLKHTIGFAYTHLGKIGKEKMV